MRVLVTGAAGFAGRHVAAELERSGHEVIALDLPGIIVRSASRPLAADLRNRTAAEQAVLEAQPDACVHLAGVAFVPVGWTDPEAVFSVNVLATINLLEAFRKHRPGARVLAVTSAEVYGRPRERVALTEDSPLEPTDLYGVSKMTADWVARLYARHHGQPVLTARPSNHVGPGQSSRFVVASFAEQVAAVSLGRAEPCIRVGNLDSRRDFTDVRDIARGYRLLVEKGHPGEAYNLASGHFTRVGEILDRLCALAGVQPRIEVDPLLFRPADPPVSLDCGKIRREVGWRPEIPLEKTLRDVFEEAKERLRAPG